MNTLVDALSVRKFSNVPSSPLGTRSTLQLLRVTTQHVPNSGRCIECDFALSGTTPLCPKAADALRELATRNIDHPSSTHNLVRLTDTELLQRAASHRPTNSGRCTRCGFSYTADVRDCPQLRSIRRVLEARGTIPLTQSEPGAAICAGRPQAWEIKGQNLSAWKRAMASCSECPLLKQCRESLRQGQVLPADQIMAGTVYDYYGKPVADHRLRAYAVDRGRKPRTFHASGTNLRGEGEVA
jgi:hypothetical protein